MTVGSFLKKAANQLEAAGLSSARLDSLILLEDITGHDRAWLLAHPEHKLNNLQLKRLNSKVERRAKHEPIAYIRGFSDFYGRKFKVSKRVLEPRPESETMIELLKSLPLPAKPALADIGTGTGCLGITAALELTRAEVDLYDIDSSCLAIAKHNCSLHELKLNVRKRDLLNRPLRRYDVILANLPYVPDHWHINPAAGHEPRLAIFGGKDGLDHYRRLFEQIKTLGWTHLYVLTEALPPQHEELALVAQRAGFKQSDSQDFIQVFTN
jgi:release factor glutamine methyltransferase